MEREQPLSSAELLQDFLRSPDLIALGQERHADFRDAEPFPHILLDNFLPEEILRSIIASFDSLESEHWRRFDHTNSVKRGCPDEGVMPTPLRTLFRQLNSAPFLLFLQALSGIEGLVGDPHLVGGGLHEIERGGFLKIHADFNFHKKLHLSRRLNVLIYLNEDWHEEYGGHLELWDREMQSCVRRILPVSNRCVVFATDDESYHGHPEPLTCPPDRVRKSIATYYYTSPASKDRLIVPHATLYQRRPGQNDPGTSTPLVQSMGSAIRWMTPPFLLELGRWLFRRQRRTGSVR